MKLNNMKSEEIFYENEGIALLHGDCFELLRKIDGESINVVIADPPYFLSSGGITNSGGKMVSVNKGEWDSKKSIEEKISYNKKWLNLIQPLLKTEGTLWVSGTLHNIYALGVALELENYRILNNITWQKTNPAPNLSCRYFTHSTETILWACNANNVSKHYFNYLLMKEINGGKQMKDVWTGSLTKKSEKKYGKHPTQKPEYLLERMILASTNEGDVILDPFIGSGTTAVVAQKLNRKCIGIEKDKSYLEIAKCRLESI